MSGVARTTRMLGAAITLWLLVASGVVAEPSHREQRIQEAGERFRSTRIRTTTVGEILGPEFQDFLASWVYLEHTDHRCVDLPADVLPDSTFDQFDIELPLTISGLYVTCTAADDSLACERDWTVLVGEMPRVLLREHFPRLSPADQRRTLAHEMGHHVWHEHRDRVPTERLTAADPRKLIGGQFGTAEMIRADMESDRAWARFLRLWRDVLQRYEISDDPDTLRDHRERFADHHPMAEYMIRSYEDQIDTRRQGFESVAGFHASSWEECFARLFDTVYYRTRISNSLDEYRRMVIRTSPTVEAGRQRFEEDGIEIREDWELDLLSEVWVRLTEVFWRASERFEHDSDEPPDR